MTTDASAFELAPLKAPTKERSLKKKWYPMVFVGGIGIRTTPDDLIQSFADQGFDIMIRPSIRTGKSFSYCPNVALRTDEQVQKALDMKQMTIGERVVDIRPHKHASPVLPSNVEPHPDRTSAYEPERYSLRNINPQRSSFTSLRLEESRAQTSSRDSYLRADPYHRQISRSEVNRGASMRKVGRYYDDRMEYWEDSNFDRYPELTYREQLVLQELMKNREEKRNSRRESKRRANLDIEKLYRRALAHDLENGQPQSPAAQASAYRDYKAEYGDRHGYRVREVAQGAGLTPEVNPYNPNISRRALESEEDRLRSQLRKVRIKLDAIESRQAKTASYRRRLSDPSLLDYDTFRPADRPKADTIASTEATKDSKSSSSVINPSQFDLNLEGIFRQSFDQDAPSATQESKLTYRYSSPPQSPLFNVSKEDEVQKQLNAEFKKQHMIRKSLRMSTGSQQKLLILVKDPEVSPVPEPEDDVDAVQGESQVEELYENVFTNSRQERSPVEVFEN